VAHLSYKHVLLPLGPSHVYAHLCHVRVTTAYPHLRPANPCLPWARLQCSAHLRSYASAATAAVRPSPLASTTRPRLRATLAAAPLAPGHVLALFIWEDGVSTVHLGRAHPVVFVERAHLTLIRLLFYCPHKLLKGDKWKNGENLCSLMLGVYT